jgi:hypothetical protein
VLDWKELKKSGRGAAWLARLLGVQEVPSSNLGGPTKFLIALQLTDLPEVAVWSPTGVQSPEYLDAKVGQELTRRRWLAPTSASHNSQNSLDRRAAEW